MVQRHRHSGGYILGHGGYILAHYIPVYGDHIMVQKCDRQLMEVICRSSKVIFGVAWLYSEDGGYSLGTLPPKKRENVAILKKQGG